MSEAFVIAPLTPRLTPKELNQTITSTKEEYPNSAEDRIDKDLIRDELEE